MKMYIGTKIIKAQPMIAGKALEAGYKIGKALLTELGMEVEYPDGYRAWSPGKAFIDAYRPFNGMNFGLAIEALKKGLKVARSGWNGKGLCLELQIPDAHSKMTLPYIYMSYPSAPASDTAPANHINAKVPWLASQTDILADDWQVVD